MRKFIDMASQLGKILETKINVDAGDYVSENEEEMVEEDTKKTMPEWRAERDRRELERRMGQERRNKVLDAVAELDDRREHQRRKEERRQKTDNTKVSQWIKRFDNAREK